NSSATRSISVERGHRGFRAEESGGVEGDRTLDLRIANAALSQLSYHPSEGAEFYYHSAPERNRMEIKPPFGFTDIAPLNRNQKVRLLAPGEVPAFARGVNSMPISYTEFALIAREYPIVFTSAADSQVFAPVAVLGM